MTDINALVTDHIEIWTSAIKTQSTSGRGHRKKLELTGIKKLRELILELAVRGKLVPQDPDDEPASVLLEKIAVEKERLVKEKKIKKPKKLSEITDSEKLFSLPIGWSYSRLNDLGEWGAGSTPKRSNTEYYGGDIPWFKSGELTADYISKSEETVTKLALKESSLRYNNVGDVLLAMYGATIGKTSILNVPATTNQAVCACTTFSGFKNIYLLTLLKAYKHRFIGMGAGGAQPNISREKIVATVILLPPTAEQHRIVAKVNELMALCDQLEQQSEESITTHQTLVDTLLDVLVSPEQNAAAFADSWTLIEQHFDTLFTTEQSIDKLKQTILQLAVMGKLVPQDPNDEPASVLLEKIAAEKEQLVKEKNIKKPKKHIDISEDEKLFELPLGWTYIRFGDLTQDVATGPFGSMIHKSDYVKGGVPLINPSHMVNGKVIEDMNISVTEDKAQELSSYSLSIGDIIMARRGEMGRCALITERESSWICGTGSFILSFFHEIPREFILLLFKTPWVRDYLGGESIGTTMTNLNHGILKKLPVLIPPLSEQHRIVAKVDKLMNFCNKLKIQLERKKVIQQHLTDAFVEKTLSKESL